MRKGYFYYKFKSNSILILKMLLIIILILFAIVQIIDISWLIYEKQQGLKTVKEALKYYENYK